MGEIRFKNIFSNSMWQIIEKIATMLLSVVVTSCIARYLGPEEYGLVNYVISVVTLFTAFSVLGMQELTIKALNDGENSVNKILGTSFVLRIIGSIFLIVVSQVTLFILNGNNLVYQLLGIIISSCMLFKAFEVIEYYLQSTMNLKSVSIIRFCTTICVVVFRILVIYFKWGTIGFAVSYLVDAVVAAVLFYIYYKTRTTLPRWKFDKKYAISILKKCWNIAIAGLLGTIYMRIDQVMLKELLNDTTQNGIYSAATRISEMWYFIPTAIIASFQPAINKKKNNDEKGYNRLTQQLYDVIALIGIVFAIGISLFGWLAIDILYGKAYVDANQVLLISVWAGLFASLGSARVIWLINENLQKYTIVYTLIGAIVNVILNIIIIPKCGATGAAITTLVSQIITNVFVLMLFKETRKSSFMILKSIFLNGTLIEIFRKLKKRA